MMMDIIGVSLLATGATLLIIFLIRLLINWIEWSYRAPALETDVETENKMPTCTYCGGTAWYSGPSGGMSTNILCANEKCRHWFNYTPAPFDMLDDLKKVEPTDEEKTRAQSDRRATADAQRLLRYSMGRKAFVEGQVIGSLRTSVTYGGYAEAADNIDRMCGFIDAMSEVVRGTPRETITDTNKLLGIRNRGDEDRQ